MNKTKTKKHKKKHKLSYISFKIVSHEKNIRKTNLSKKNNQSMKKKKRKINLNKKQKNFLFSNQKTQH